MAYNAAYSEARVKMATDAGYQPSAHIAELAGSGSQRIRSNSKKEEMTNKCSNK